MAIANISPRLALIIAIATFVGCSASSSPTPLQGAESSDHAAKEELAELRKRLATAELQLSKQREVIIQLGADVDWLRSETANALGDQWRTVRSPSSRSMAESKLDDEEAEAIDKDK
jgi:hypothetical protein